MSTAQKTTPPPLTDAARMKARLNDAYHQDENASVAACLAAMPLSQEARGRVRDAARGLVATVRANRKKFGGLDRFLQEFGLTTAEGIALMCLAEALLRIPDSATADRMIRDKIGGADWDRHLGKTGDLFVNASTWALMLTGKVLDGAEKDATLGRMLARLGEPVVRQAMLHAMKIMGRQFVMGRTIEEALDRARADEKAGYRHSYDMLGEGARTAEDAHRYFQAYESAIDAIGHAAGGRDIGDAPGISVKLSALHPRYEYAQRQACVPALSERLLALAQKCAGHGVGLTVDAEEAHRLEISLDIFENVFSDPSLRHWEGLGLAVQAYQKRCGAAIGWLAALAGGGGRRIMVRLVKGAYWDSEIKYAQVNGLPGYPVFTRKNATDVSYLSNLGQLLGQRKLFYPMVATHNAWTLAAALEMAGADKTGFEFQRLHGMGEPLYHQIADKYPCRIYAPVGSHQDLLPYLVRRLLENGANSSFVNRLQDDSIPLDAMAADPVAHIEGLASKPHPKIPLPEALYADRKNAKGMEFANGAAGGPLLQKVHAHAAKTYDAAPLVAGKKRGGTATPVTDPADRRRTVGHVVFAAPADMDAALDAAHTAFPAWNAAPAETRAACLERAADIMEERMAELIALCVREAGKTLNDALAEVREAVDFCRYYAAEGRRHFGAALPLPGPTGEMNTLTLEGRGVFLCISPWNFPLAIFTGQVAAALMAGNAVIAKPAEQTSLTAMKAAEIFLEAGIPAGALSLLPADGAAAGRRLLPDPRIAGVCFTGSTEVARLINRALAARDGAIAPLIAETGGQNAMIADSSALPEQVVDDAVRSAFHSAGQRCSALRVLFVQEGIADKVIRMLEGACREISCGDPLELATDVGPVIDETARAALEEHAHRMASEGRLVAQAPLLPAATQHGSFCAPRAYEIAALSQLTRENFGPILHVIRYRPEGLEKIIDDINATGYGLTFGIHTRIDETVRRACARVRAGNCYVNRSMTGAVVGVQPFGGNGLSGTGPKAGGPHYLPRFAVERVVTVNTTASGGNTTLVSLGEEDGA